MFPSPCGEKVGINRGGYDTERIVREVSVPLRGKGRDQRSRVNRRVGLGSSCFRPLAGKR